MRLISDGFGSWPLADGVSRSSSPSRMSLHSFTHSLQMYTDGPDTRRATSSWPRPQNEQRIGWGVAMRFFMLVSVPLDDFGCLRGALLATLLDDLVDETVRLGLLGRHEEIAVGVPVDHIVRPSGVLGEDAVELLPHLEHLLRVDLDVRGLALRPPERLVDHDPGVGKSIPLAGG